MWADLIDLVLPARCAGCRRSDSRLRYGTCAGCATTLEALRPWPVRPTPAPPGLPPCTALGAYDGVLREALLSYKERGRHGLARPLGLLLAQAVASSVGVPKPLLLIPVPATARAVRQRYGDHVLRLARHAAGQLRRSGWSVALARPLRALPRPDSAALDAAARAAAAGSAFRSRPGRLPALRRAASGRAVVVLDDIVTTGVTLAAVARQLSGADVPVTGAVLLAATTLRHRRP